MQSEFLVQNTSLDGHSSQLGDLKSASLGGQKRLTWWAKRLSWWAKRLTWWAKRLTWWAKSVKSHLM